VLGEEHVETMRSLTGYGSSLTMHSLETRIRALDAAIAAGERAEADLH
jgi:hypothetical protein